MEIPEDEGSFSGGHGDSPLRVLKRLTDRAESVDRFSMTRWLAIAVIVVVMVAGLWIVVTAFVTKEAGTSGPFLTTGPTTPGPSR
jgi:hypothetical protein